MICCIYSFFSRNNFVLSKLFFSTVVQTQDRHCLLFDMIPMVNWPAILNASVRKLPVHGHVTKILSYFQPWPYDLQCCPILVQMAFFQRVFCIMWHDINFDGHQKKTKPCVAVSSSVVHVSCQICILIGIYWIICIHIGSANFLLNEHLSAPPGLGIFNCQIPTPED